MEENKALICRKICEMLQSTRHYSHIKSMLYVHNWDEDKKERINKTAPTDYILVKYEKNNGTDKLIDVSADSGYGMLKDVLRYI